MDGERVTTKPFVQDEWFGKEKGLSKEADNSGVQQKVKCPNCGVLIEFFPNEYWWNSDGNFEFFETACPECNQGFELCAGGIPTDEPTAYDFFISN